MTLALKRIKVYLKFLAILAVVAIILTVVVMNRNNTATVWFFWIDDTQPVNVLWLILITAISSIAGWWGLHKVFGIMREVREVRRQAEVERRLAEQRRLAEELAERERRIDEKVKRSISDPTQP